jgi:hypothetical protein
MRSRAMRIFYPLIDDITRQAEAQDGVPTGTLINRRSTPDFGST